MTDKTNLQELLLDPHLCEDLPKGRPNAAHLHAVGFAGSGGIARALLRRRRTSEMLMLAEWTCQPHDRLALADRVQAFAKASDARLIRANEDQADAIDALGLIDTGRGYAQRWIGDAIRSQHQTGRFIQTTGFTCGPVSIAMALGESVTRMQEMTLWREATTVIGLTGPGGCDPYGLALAAARQGLKPEIFFDSEGPILLDRADTEAKRDLMRFVQTGFKEEADRSLPVHRRALSAEELTAAVRSGAQVVLLIDQCHTHDHHAPHWILVHAELDGVFLINDPWAEPEDDETVCDVDCMPVRLERLIEMASYGNPAYRAALVLHSR
ncbi:peptidase C39 family protein [Seohaeicola nanhaiensis]|uniref:Peptidase C39 family protein n=1 Tax=Seohaeicola nanhaiensis TaxID=1387282 RepID=A0ABV9KBT6_9RHOB